MEKLTISMAIFNSFLYVYQRVKPILSDGETWWNPCFHHVEARWWLNMVDPLGPETSPDLTGGTFEILCHLQGFHTVLRSGEFSNKTGRKLRFKQRMWGTIGSLQACAGWYTSFFGKFKANDDSTSISWAYPVFNVFSEKRSVHHSSYHQQCVLS